MCLAIVKPAGQVLTREKMAHAFAANPDGCGFAVRRGGQVHIAKGCWSFAEFWRRLEAVMAFDLLVHVRWATAGTVSAANCHPFALAGGGALIHNGHLGGYGTGDESDTAEWVRRVFNPLLRTYPGALGEPAVLALLAASAPGSKFAILTPTQTVIIGEKAGHWEGGVWYSNHSYAPAPRLRAWAPLWDVDDAGADEARCDLCGADAPAAVHLCYACFQGPADDDEPADPRWDPWAPLADDD
jgi:hypothetical protein